MNRQTETKAYTAIKLAVPALMALAALASVSCEDSDPVAIEGSEMILTASPNPVDLLVDPTGRSTVQARVTSSSGVPEEDVIVFFSTTNGAVDPDSNTTDSLGRAFTTFSNTTTTTATVSARSGGVTGTIQIQVLQGTASNHQLNAVPDAVFNTCGEIIGLQGTVTGSSGAISGAQVTFQVISSTPAALTTFNPSTDVTDVNGQYSINLIIDSNLCNSTCGTTTCTVTVRATAAGAPSNDVIINDGI